MVSGEKGLSIHAVAPASRDSALVSLASAERTRTEVLEPGLLPQAADDLSSVHAGHGEIAENEVEDVLLEDLESLLPVFRFLDFIAFETQGEP